MSLAQLKWSLALWRARLKYRSVRWKYWQHVNNKAGVAKWEKLRLEAIANIHLRERQIQVIEHPPRPERFAMYDSTTISEIPRNAVAVAGYTSGYWPTFPALVRAFPHAKHLSIAVNAAHDADCLDVETGDATPGEAPAWVKRQKARGVQRPCVYANTSTMPAVLAALGRAGINRSQVRVWTAHYTGEPHIEPGSDATQWTDKALGRNLDQSLCSGDFL